MRARKLIAAGITSLMLMASVYTVKAEVLHEEIQIQTITSGVKHIVSQRLTTSGWQNIQSLEIDLDNPNVKLKPLESNNLGERQTILDMATQSGAVAGVNADFFDMSASFAPSFGASIVEGSIKHAYNSNYSDLGPKKYMATFLLDEINNPLINYYSVCASLYLDSAKIFDIGAYNNLMGSLNLPIAIDSRYYETTAKLNNKYRAEGVYTMLVTDNSIAYISAQDEVVNIPKDSYAVVMNSKAAAKYLPQLTVGSSVHLEQTIQLDGELQENIENLKMGIGGGGIIMKDGQAYTGNAHKLTPNSGDPRTILATSKYGNQVLLITIDGRDGTIGATHNGLIELLTNYGIKDAMYLDGGGSTTLVARDEAQTDLKVKNNPSEGTQRKVTNGVGVYTVNDTGELAKLYIEPSTKRSFVGEPISFKLKGVDENDNPVIVGDTAKVTVEGITGKWQGDLFYPDSAGTAVVIASADTVQVATEIFVSATPVALRIEPSYLQIPENSNKTISLYGIDAQGYKVPISSQNVAWTSNNPVVSIAGASITTKAKTLAKLTATYKNVSTSMGVVVGDTTQPIDSFETPNAIWGGDTSGVQGKVEQSYNNKYYGTQSVKMTYTFSPSASKQVAYMVFNKPIAIGQEANAINLWAYATGKGDILKVQLKDALGQTHYLKLSDGLQTSGWQYLTTSLPTNVKLPAEITKIYTYANTVEAKRTSEVFIDHLSITRGLQDKASLAVRADYLFDSQYKQTLQQPIAGENEVHVMGPTQINSMKLSAEATQAMANVLQTHNAAVVLASKNNVALPLASPIYSYQNAYSYNNLDHTDLIFIGTDNGSIRLTAGAQWLSLKKDLENTVASHIILVMSQNPLTQFSDSKEGKSLHNYLKDYKEKTGKDIFVVTTGGVQKETCLEEGIRYIKLNGFNNLTDDPKQGEYLRFKVTGNQIYYTFEKVMP